MFCGRRGSCLCWFLLHAAVVALAAVPAIRAEDATAPTSPVATLRLIPHTLVRNLTLVGNPIAAAYYTDPEHNKGPGVPIVLDARFTTDPEKPLLVVRGPEGMVVWDWRAYPNERFDLVDDGWEAKGTEVSPKGGALLTAKKWAWVGRDAATSASLQGTDAEALADPVRRAAFLMTKAAAVSDDGRLFIRRSANPYEGDNLGGTVDILKVGTNSVVAALEGSHRGNDMNYFHFAQFVDSRNRVVAVNAMTGFCLWEPTSGTLTQRGKFAEYNLICGAVMRERKMLRFWGRIGDGPGAKVSLFDWNWETGELAPAPRAPDSPRFVFPPSGTLPFGHFAISPDGTLVVYPGPFDTPNSIVYDMDHGTVAVTIERMRDGWKSGWLTETPVFCVFSADGRYLAMGFSPNIVRVWETRRTVGGK